jgi:hypothetical protein
MNKWTMATNCPSPLVPSLILQSTINSGSDKAKTIGVSFFKIYGTGNNEQVDDGERQRDRSVYYVVSQVE